MYETSQLNLGILAAAVAPAAPYRHQGDGKERAEFQGHASKCHLVLRNRRESSFRVHQASQLALSLAPY